MGPTQRDRSRPDYPGHEWTNVGHWRARARANGVGVAISDTSAGMFLGQGILLALLHRERTGEGHGYVVA